MPYNLDLSSYNFTVASTLLYHLNTGFIAFRILLAVKYYKVSSQVKQCISHPKDSRNYWPPRIVIVESEVIEDHIYNRGYSKEHVAYTFHCLCILKEILYACKLKTCL